jgi:prefoldin alpha subunit
MDDDRITQENALRMQILEQQAAAVQKQVQQLEEQLAELDITKESLDELKKSKSGADMLSMLSPGIFVKTSLANNEEVIINVGGNVAVKKKTSEAKKMIEEQIGEIKNIQAQLVLDMQKFNEAILKMEKEQDV